MTAQNRLLLESQVLGDSDNAAGSSSSGVRFPSLGDGNGSISLDPSMTEQEREDIRRMKAAGASVGTRASDAWEGGGGEAGADGASSSAAASHSGSGTFLTSVAVNGSLSSTGVFSPPRLQQSPSPSPQQARPSQLPGTAPRGGGGGGAPPAQRAAEPRGAAQQGGRGDSRSSAASDRLAAIRARQAESRRSRELQQAVAAGEALASADDDERFGASETRTVRERAKLALEALLSMSAEAYQELAFDADSGEHQYDDEQLEAATAFDLEHASLTSLARRQLVGLEYDPSNLQIERLYNAQVRAVRRLRYFVPELAGTVRAVKPKRRRKARWRLETSCWAPRKADGNSKDFFETNEAMRRLFDADWNVAVRSHELAWYIVKCHHDPTSWRDLDRNGVHDEVDEVKEALWQHHRMIYGAFDYYATLYSDNENAPGEPDVFNISLNGYMAFAEHCKMVSKQVPHGEFEVIWSIVNAVDKTTANDDRHNKGRFLNRQEFMQCLVRMAIAVYCKRGLIGDVSDAVNQLMVNNLMGNLISHATQNSNAFRKRFCYIEKTSLVLEANVGSLRILYEQYGAAISGTGDSLKNDDLMSVGEWLTFCRHLGLVEAGFLSVQQCKHIFIWSRIRSADDLGDRSEMRLRHLFPTDFLEGLVRMSTMVALPTDFDIFEAGAADAGELLLAMQAKQPKAFQRFLKTHAPQHADPDGSDWEAHCQQPIWRCVEHLIKLLVRTVEFNTSATRDSSVADGVVQADEAAKFLRKRTAGQLLESVEGSLGSTDFFASMDNAASKVITTAAAIKIQMASRLRKARQRIRDRRAALAAQAGGEGAEAADAEEAAAPEVGEPQPAAAADAAPPADSAEAPPP